MKAIPLDEVLWEIGKPMNFALKKVKMKYYKSSSIDSL